MPVIMVVWLRFTIHAVVAGAVLFPIKGFSLIKTNHLRWHLLRALMFIAMTGINFWALQYLQLTVTSAIFFTVPLIIAMLGAPLLGERLDAGRWIAIIAGFIGVLVIVRPGSADFHPAMLGSMVNAVLYALFMLMTRRLAVAHRYAPSTVIAPFLYQQVFYMALIGYFVFGDVPGAAVWIGAAIVIASGLYLFHRERQR